MYTQKKLIILVFNNSVLNHLPYPRPIYVLVLRGETAPRLQRVQSLCGDISKLRKMVNVKVVIGPPPTDFYSTNLAGNRSCLLGSHKGINIYARTGTLFSFYSTPGEQGGFPPKC